MKERVILLLAVIWTIHVFFQEGDVRKQTCQGAGYTREIYDLLWEHRDEENDIETIISSLLFGLYCFHMIRSSTIPVVKQFIYLV
jgi:hypothetical protein